MCPVPCDAAYWFDMYVEGDFEAGPTLVGPEGATTINIAGVGFGVLFNPLARNQMKCEFNGRFPLFGCRAWHARAGVSQAAKFISRSPHTSSPVTHLNTITPCPSAP